uniref:Immunoglobulin subtype domain-containing protein n=1 Tax=Salvator merianae TaxID=96440 RepID=A0A8D0BH71_SALMN
MALSRGSRWAPQHTLHSYIFLLTECAHKVGIEGGDIVLSSGIVTEGNLDEISFKKEGNKVAEWDPYLNYTYYSSMVNRSEIDIHSGHLTIRNLSQNDTGNYMVEVTIAGKIKVTCFVLEVLVPLEPPDLHCEVVSGTIKVNCTPTIQDLRLKYDWHYTSSCGSEFTYQIRLQKDTVDTEARSAGQEGSMPQERHSFLWGLRGVLPDTLVALFLKP